MPRYIVELRHPTFRSLYVLSNGMTAEVERPMAGRLLETRARELAAELSRARPGRKVVLIKCS